MRDYSRREANPQDALIHEQINRNDAEIEQRRKSLTQQKLEGAKSQGRENWISQNPAGSGGSQPMLPPTQLGGK